MLAIDAAVRDLLVAMASIDPGQRAAAIELITELGEEALAPLVRALDDPNPNTRMCAVRALGILKDERTIPHVVRMLTDDVRLVRQVAGIAFVNFGGVIVPQLLQIVEEGDHRICEAVLSGLHQLYDGYSDPTELIEAITSHRGRALPALIKLRLNETHWLDLLWEDIFARLDVILFAPLTEYFEYFAGPSVDLFVFCVNLLELQAEIPEPREYVIDCFISTLYIATTERQFVQSLLRLAKEDANVVDRLLHVYPHVPSEKKELLAYIFSQTHTQRAVPLLIETLKSSKTKERALVSAIRALGSLGAEEALGALHDLRDKTKNSLLQDAAYDAIWRILDY